MQLAQIFGKYLTLIDTSKIMLTASTTITNHLIQAQNILIIASTPVDGDSMHTALALRLWLLEQDKAVRIISWKDFVGVFPQNESAKLIEYVPDYSVVNWVDYDTVVIVDGSAWQMAIGNNFETIISSLPTNLTILHIDHHEPKDISGDDRVLSFVDTQAKSACEVLYYHILKSSNHQVSKDVGQHVYQGMLSDTMRFRIVGPYTYQCAQELLDMGLQHSQLVSERISEQAMRFTGWAINRTQFFQEARLLILEIDKQTDAQLKEQFGENYANEDIDDYYKYAVFGHIFNYDYGVTFEQDDDLVKIRWRTANDASNTVELAAIFTRLGCANVGGHRNAGGGVFHGTTQEIVARLVPELTKAVSI